jgi:hypothetical protein
MKEGGCFPIIMQRLIQRFSAITIGLTKYAILYRSFVAFGVIIVGSAFLIPGPDVAMQGDVSVYQGVANDLFKGALPYRDHVLEYPPYAIPIFLLPRIFGEGNYLIAFLSLAFVADWLVKALVLLIGFGQSKTVRALFPVMLYSAAVPFIHFFYLQRYDIWPALLCLIAIWLFCSGRYLTSGVAFSFGIGIKLYPIVFVPPLMVLALRQGKGRDFIAGLVLGLFPVVLLSFWLPWWEFAAFQTNRGLQVESLYASLLWLGQLIGVANVDWSYVNKWYEVEGPLATAVLPWARGVFLIGVGGSTTIAIWIAFRLQKIDAPTISRLLLIPLLAFVAWNPVLSPQYMIWLLPLAALASLEGSLWAPCAICLATVLTPIFYPSSDYGVGLSLMETLVLLIRNLILIAAWGSLIRESLRKIFKELRFGEFSPL